MYARSSRLDAARYVGGNAKRCILTLTLLERVSRCREIKAQLRLLLITWRAYSAKGEGVLVIMASRHSLVCGKLRALRWAVSGCYFAGDAK